jgi:hypothetical protein
LNEREKKLRREISKWLNTIAKNVEGSLELKEFHLKLDDSPIVTLDMSTAKGVVTSMYSMDAEISLDNGQ